MNTLPTTTSSVSLHQIARHVNNVSLGEEILVFDHDVSLASDPLFPIRIDAFIIAICTAGSGRIGIDLNHFELRKNSLFVLQPRNYINLSEYSDTFRCSVIACSTKIIEEIMPRLSDMSQLLMDHRNEPVTLLPENDAAALLSFYSFLRAKIDNHATRFQRQKVVCLMQAAIYELMDMRLETGKKPSPLKSRKEEIMARFLISVTENFRTQRQVADYARMLCISPKHLSTIVKELSSRTAGDWIEHYVVMEAKTLLRNTDMTIQEVACSLNFPNQSFFGKYFKHHTGMSPTEFRKVDS